MLLTWIGVIGGYGLGGLVVMRAVFEQGRARFRRTTPVETERFDQQERQHIEVVALVAGLLWIVVLPAIVLGRLVARLGLARPRGSGGDPVSAGRIDELERVLSMGPYAPVDDPVER
ncbi:hypothetical protein [Kitasatospora sp. NPDC098663]|uniref:hypothetical protein n=1 Tax=Kitasatospora sp. NPDC098663 TaxID=3364096 RepID=UPI003827709F